MAVGVALFSIIVFGTVTRRRGELDGSNTRNGVTQGPALPDGVEVAGEPAGRRRRPSRRRAPG